MSLHAASQLLTRHSHWVERPELGVLGEMRLARARVHELCGMARRTLALIAAGRDRGPVFWIAPSWTRGGPNPEGFLDLVDPGRLIFVAPRRPEDLLWCLEEVLRSGMAGLAVVDLPGPPGLTAVRRLHLAAETGAEAGADAGIAPLGLILTPEGASQGVESRWGFAPRHEGETARFWQLERLRHRSVPPARWRVGEGEKGFELKPC